MVTAAAVAHVNRLPVLLLPGDVFASRRPDPVLQQIESFGDGTISANDCFRPVSRYFDRITRPEQIIAALPRALAALTDPAECGPVTLALCQDVQAEAFDYPDAFFAEHVWKLRRIRPDERELVEAAAALARAKRPLIIAGGGVHYSDACDALRVFAETHGVPVAETQAGKSALPHNHALNLGAIGVTGTSAANALAAEADLVLAVGTRLQDFTTGSWALFRNPERCLIGLNVQGFDAGKHHAMPLVADAKIGLERLSSALAGRRAPEAWRQRAGAEKASWVATAAEAKAASNAPLPSDAQVIGAVQRVAGASDIVVCAAGGLPGELHKLWDAAEPGGYHLEYGYSCMGYEIAGGLGVKMACPDRDVIVMVGDGSYLMMNSEIATSVMLGQKLIIVVLDNRGFGCINRLQRATGGESFNNLLEHARHVTLPAIDFRAHAESLGAVAEKVASLADLEEALRRARRSDRTSVIVIDTDPLAATEAGGHWWDVVVPEVSERAEVRAARDAYDSARQNQRLGN
jgi:3D-(3,5/4)-trihydroxycyclohexane-1,2-dione acylhydrolase (decyclizing)